MNLLDIVKNKSIEQNAPLAERLKPETLDAFVGQSHLVGQGKLLSRLILSDRVTSMILHGPPGTGKTSLAKIIANSTNAVFTKLNAVTAGVKDIRQVIEEAENSLTLSQKHTILFVDEIHRFNKSQQDALLPYVENGTVTLIGATTENPYYEVNNALLSRSTVFELKSLNEDDIVRIVEAAIANVEKGLGMFELEIEEGTLSYLASRVGGDARKALNTIELAVLSTDKVNGKTPITKAVITECLYSSGVQYDKSADNHYNTASAFIKSMRGSDPDAALHYLARMIVGGEDVKFIARRIVIAASEDVGNADPNALAVALNAAQAAQFVGFPEARIILAQAATYVASAPKSNAAYVGINEAIEDVRSGRAGQIPAYLQDMTANGLKGKFNNTESDSRAYKYAHDYPNHYVDQQYLPEDLVGTSYYRPTDNGFEKEIRAHLKKLKG
ncbi:MAG: replication-associated recombination protein A [Clostridia bacterium]|nr:replication-associated recombination protein A [Clostridia bacterium]